jgi:predicted PurR-regulated permease PerM
LRLASDYAWRVLLLGAVAYFLYQLVLRFETVFVALFIAMVFTALLRPPANLLSRFLPRPLAVAGSGLGGLCLVAGTFYLAGVRVASEAPSLSTQFHGGLQRIETWLEGAPFHVKPTALTQLQSKATTYVDAHRGALLSQALSGASRAADVLAVLALAVFCSIFFTHSGEHMWQWFERQLPEGVRSTWQRCGSAAWHTFAGYTHGIILVAAANATMVGISLAVLRVPLVLPLILLEFFLSFVPLIGSPIAMAVATLIALASRGVTTAVIVIALIVLFGQIEGHVLQPFVMGWAVRLHPVVVAVSVIAGTIAAGLLGAVVAVPFVSICWAVVGELRAGASTAAGAGPPAGAGPLDEVDPQAPDDPSGEHEPPITADPPHEATA